MLAITCFNCRRQFNVDETAIADRLAELKEEGAKYYAIECPHCRKVNKVALARLTGGRRRRARRRSTNR
jgi:DNA-directed RNA polymerase subunit RPC12/RpoP